jgi:hypothetical protein
MLKKCIPYKFPTKTDFEDNIHIDKINSSDYNILRSRIYNRSYYNWINIRTRIPGFDNKYYKISSQLPNIHDTMSYYTFDKTYDFITYREGKSIDTMDLMLIRQNIDKKQRYENVDRKIVKYGKYTSPSRRFIIYKY